MPKIAWNGLYIHYFGFSMKQRQDRYKNNRLKKLLEEPRKLRSIQDLLFKNRDKEELWEIDTKSKYKWLAKYTINKEKKIE